MDNSYFVGWGTFALINAGLAQGKNRSGLIGTIATLSLVISSEKLKGLSNK